jgi:hippurate hydrolase
LALHVTPFTPAGVVTYVDGFAYANVDSVDIHVRGIGGHGAYPHTTKDPVVIGAQIVMTLQTITSREIAAQDPAVVTVGAFNAGAKHNVISDEAHLQLTVRSYSDETREKILAAIERIAINTGKAAGLPDDLLPIVTRKKEFTPALWNDPDLTANIADALAQALGAHNVKKDAPVMGGEDFGRYGRVEPKIPSLMFGLGAISQSNYDAAARGEINLPSLHSSKFAPDAEPTIKTGVEAMTTAALHLLTNP